MPATVRRRPLTTRDRPRTGSRRRWLVVGSAATRGATWRGTSTPFAWRGPGRHPDLLGHGPLIVVLNHPSWWDPLVGLILSERFPGRTHYAPIEAAALARYPLLGPARASSGSTPGRRGAREFLRVGAGVLARSRERPVGDGAGRVRRPARAAAAAPGRRRTPRAHGSPGVCVVPAGPGVPVLGTSAPPRPWPTSASRSDSTTAPPAGWTERIARAAWRPPRTRWPARRSPASRMRSRSSSPAAPASAASTTSGGRARAALGRGRLSPRAR